MSKLSNKIEAYNKITAARGKTFHANEQDAMNKGTRAQIINEATQSGLGDAQLFLASVRIPESPDHDKNRTIYENTFNRSETSVKNYFVNKAYAAIDSGPLETKNQARENKTLGGFNNLDNDDEAIVNNFAKLMRAKWDAVGYEKPGTLSDDEEIANYFKEYPLKENNRMGSYVRNICDPAPATVVPSGGSKASY